MPNYRRLFVPGGTYFFTAVTARRAPVFQNAVTVNLFRSILTDVRQRRPFDIVAAVILPDHLHMIWSLPKGDDDYPTRWAAIKAGFTRAYLATGGSEQALSSGQRREQRRGVWQRRYMEHTIHDERDLAEHVDYVHFNPVKHGLARRPIDWPWSSIHRFIATGRLSDDWGSVVEADHEPGATVNATMLE